VQLWAVGIILVETQLSVLICANSCPLALQFRLLQLINAIILWRTSGFFHVHMDRMVWPDAIWAKLCLLRSNRLRCWDAWRRLLLQLLRGRWRPHQILHPLVICSCLRRLHRRWLWCLQQYMAS